MQQTVHYDALSCAMSLFLCAGYGVIFFTPMIVNALMKDEAVSSAPSSSSSVSSKQGQGGLHKHGRELLLDIGMQLAGGPYAVAARRLLGGGAMPAADLGSTAALITSIPFGLAAGAMMWVAHRSQVR